MITGFARLRPGEPFLDNRGLKVIFSLLQYFIVSVSSSYGAIKRLISQGVWTEV
jgi:hypothetical protein